MLQIRHSVYQVFACLPLVVLPLQAQADRKLEVVAEWDKVVYDLGDATAEKEYIDKETYKKVLMQGVKSDSQGNLYVSTARWGGPEVPATLSKLVKKNGKWALQPYPSKDMNQAGNPKALQAVLGFEIDKNDIMYILDQGHIAGQPSAPGAEKIILWDIKKNREIQRYEFSDVDSDKKCSFLNDVAIDLDNNFVYITDSGIFCDPLKGGLIAYDIKNNRARRVLDATVFTNDEVGFTFRIDNRPVLKKSPMRTGADGIALSGDRKTLYWTNLTGNRLYGIDTSLLRDFSASESKIRTAVRLIQNLPSNTDGLTSDRKNLYLTALQLNCVMRRNEKTGELVNHICHPEMVWPDTLSIGPGGSLYILSNHLHLWVDGDMNFNDPPVPNFRIWKTTID
jgi:sugar lactone lactonase YvrE